MKIESAVRSCREWFSLRIPPPKSLRISSPRHSLYIYTSGMSNGLFGLENAKAAYFEAPVSYYRDGTQVLLSSKCQAFDTSMESHPSLAADVAHAMSKVSSCPSAQMIVGDGRLVDMYRCPHGCGAILMAKTRLPATRSSICEYVADVEVLRESVERAFVLVDEQVVVCDVSTARD